MNQKFTLFGLFLVLATFAFGQRTINVNEKKIDKRIESRLHSSVLQEKAFLKEQLLQKISLNSNRPFLKSAQEDKPTLDSLVETIWSSELEVWYADWKEDIEYDANGNIIQHIYSEKSSPFDPWIVSWKSDYTYDEYGSLTLEMDSVWDNEEEKYIESWKFEYTYDESGNILTRTENEWDSGNEKWVKVWREESSYDESGNITERVSSQIDVTTMGLSLYMKEEYTYDDNDNLTIYLVSYWNSGIYSWYEGYKGVLSYDENGNLILFMDYDNSDGWYAYSKVEYAYDEDRNMTESINSLAGQIEGQYTTSYKSMYGYDSNGNPTLEMYLLYDSEAENFVEYARYDYAYDILTSLESLVLPSTSWFFADYSVQIVNKPLEYSGSAWDTEMKEWVESLRITYYYSDDNTTNLDITENGISEIYPNPVSEYLNFSLNGNYNKVMFELFDLQGRRLISKEVANNEKMSLKNMTSGLYLYQIQIDGNRQTGKLIKE